MKHSYNILWDTIKKNELMLRANKNNCSKKDRRARRIMWAKALIDAKEDK